MTKARTLANFISDGSTLADGAISVSEVSGAAPLASPSFTGNLTVDTNTLFVDAGNNRVGVNTSSPAQTLDVTGNIGLQNVSGATYVSDLNYPIIFPSEATGSIGFNGHLVLQPRGSAAGAVILAAGQGAGAMTERLRVGTAEAVFNETGANYDFRIESDNNFACFFVDAGNGRIGINQDVPGYTVDVVGGTNSGGDGVALRPLNESQTNILSFLGLKSTYYMQFMADSTNSGGSDYFQFHAGTQDANGELLFLGDGATTFNEGGHDRDFRVESDAYSHALFVDASTNRISLGGSGAEPNATVCIFSTTSGEPLLRLAGTTNGEIITQRFQGANSSGTLKFGDISFVPNAEEINFRPIWNGSNMLTIQPSETTVNQDSLSSHDFRVEADSNSNALKVDAGYNSGKGAVIVGTNIAPATGVDYNIAASMLKFSDALPIMATGAAWHFPSVPSNRQTQANRWKFGGFTMPHHQVNAFDAGASYSQLVIELPNGGPSGKTNLELFEIGFNYGWSSGFYMVELYQNYYTNSGYKRYQFDGGYNPSFNLHQNYGGNSISLNVLTEGTFQDGTSSVPSTATDGSYYRKTVRVSYAAYTGGMVVLTVPSWMELTLNAAEVDNGGKIRLLNPQ